MARRTTVAPPITRVHKLFRIRTIVNDSSRYKVGATTRDIGQILVDRRLSKKSILESPDKLKRARDHALNSAYLGLLIPIHRNHGFAYVKSPVGGLLDGYTFEDECPKDTHEAAIFIDRMMRFKLTNSYDSRRTYSKFHTRPFLSILSILKHQNAHISQLHYLLSIRDDLTYCPKIAKDTLAKLTKYPSSDEKAIERFNRDFGLDTKRERMEIGRSTKPLVDWCRQAGLITYDEKGWCRITEHGGLAQKIYSQYVPIWYDKLGWNAPLQSAVILLYLHAQIINKKIDKNKLRREDRDALHELQERYALWDKFTKLKYKVDFDFYYDVPVNMREQVKNRLKIMFKDLGMKQFKLETLPVASIYSLEHALKQTSREREILDLSKAFGIEIPRRECFQTKFEWETCVRLRRLLYNAIPYQGEFEGICDLPMASDNPDIIIKNNIKTLVECKSKSEWGDVVKYDKRVGGELLMYQQYAEQIKANAAVFVCEADRFDEDKFVKPFLQASERMDKIALVTWKFLGTIPRDRQLQDRFAGVVKDPKSLKPNERVLS